MFLMQKGNTKEKKNKGFTLIELVIVVAILAILVGVLAPQYTKYVEKSRKAADASNMEELVKVIEVYAIDGESPLMATKYEISIGSGSGAATSTSGSTYLNELGVTDASKHDTGLRKELETQFPNWEKLTTKSKKWGDKGSSASIIATITVEPNGSLSVSYKPAKFAAYMGSGE